MLSKLNSNTPDPQTSDDGSTHPSGSSHTFNHSMTVSLVIGAGYHPHRPRTLAECSRLSPVSILSFTVGVVAFTWTIYFSVINLSAIFLITSAVLTHSAHMISYLVAGAVVFVGVWLALLAAAWAFFKTRDVTGSILITIVSWIEDFMNRPN